jgi:hypothetical protein
VFPTQETSESRTKTLEVVGSQGRHVVPFVMELPAASGFNQGSKEMNRLVLSVLMLLISGISAYAQGPAKLGPNDSIRISWPAYVPADPDGLDTPSGYRIKAVKPTQTGTVVQTYEVGNVTTTTLTYAQLPAGAFSIAVHPFNEAGEAAASNLVGPFGKASTPKAVTGVTAVRVGAP